MERKAISGVLEKLTSEESIQPEAAVVLTVQLSQFMETNLGISTTAFFRETDESMSGSLPIPIIRFEDTPINQDVAGYPHYWVYSSPRHIFPQAAGELPFAYFDNHEAAHGKHLQNITKGLDSYVKASVGAGDPRYANTISPYLFRPDLVHGLAVVAHEPLHPFLAAIEEIEQQDYDFGEALTTFLGTRVSVMFAQEVLEPQGNLVSEFVRNYAAYTEFVYLFRRLSYFKLSEIYNRANQEAEHIDSVPEAEETLNLIRQMTGRLTRTTDAERLQEINNAVIYSDFDYAGSILIAEFFDLQGVDVKRFLLNREYRYKVVPKLINFYKANKDVPPRDLEAQWQAVLQILG